MKATSVRRLSPFCVPTHRLPSWSSKSEITLSSERLPCPAREANLPPLHRRSPCPSVPTQRLRWRSSQRARALFRGEAVAAREPGRPALLDAREAAQSAPPPHEHRPGPRRSHGRSCGAGRRPRGTDDARSRNPRDAVCGGTDPDVPSAILMDRGDRVAEVGRLLVPHAPALPEAPDPAAARADPEAAVRLLEQGTHVAERTVGGIHGRLEGAQTPPSSRETPPAAVPIQRPASRPGQSAVCARP